jgi:COMPASS component SWD3
MKRLRKAVLEGAWDVASGLIKALNPSIPRSRRKRFLYSLYKQEYIELIERQEYQKAFTYLTRKLKPLESAAASDPQEFMSLCYLLTCKRVQDCAYFSNWEGEMVGREKLIDALSKLVELDTAPVNANLAREMPPQRLVTLLRQSAAYQVEFARYHPECTPQLRTLCKDYQCSPVPNAVRDIFVGATGPLKAVTWIGDEGFMLAAAGADSFLHIWTADPGAQSARLEAQEEEQGNEECTLVSSPIDYDGVDLGSNRVASPLFSLMGHSSRVWDLASNADGSLLASVDASGCAKLWRLPGDESLRSGSSLPVAQFVTDMHVSPS